MQKCIFNFAQRDFHNCNMNVTRVVLHAVYFVGKFLFEFDYSCPARYTVVIR